MSHQPPEHLRTRQLFAPSAKSTYLQFLSTLWQTTCAAAWGERHATTGLDALHRVLHPWAARPIPAVCRRPSLVSADGFPAEISLSWRGGLPEVRILFEPATGNDTAIDSQRNGQRLIRHLTGLPGVAIDRYLAIEDLFVAPDPHPYRSAVWMSLACHPSHQLIYKAYLNPWITGEPWPVVGEAMRRLGLSDAWKPVADQQAAIVTGGAELDYVALDLSSDPRARIKVYFRHRARAATSLNQLADLAEQHDPVRARSTIDTVRGAAQDGLDNEPMTGLAFRSGSHEPGEANLYLRLPGCATTDRNAADKITTIMRGEHIDPTAFWRILTALTPAPLQRTAGLIELLSYRTRGPGAADIGIYLRLAVHAPEPTNRPRIQLGYGLPSVAAIDS